MNPERHYALDLVRGTAAIGVFLYHALDKQGIVLQSLGMFGVYIFFALSALTMAMVYGGTFTAGVLPSAAFSFYRNRAARVMPLLALVAIGGGYFAARQELSVFGLSQAALTATGLFSLASPGMLSNAGGAWSLGIELWFYLLAPIAIMLVVHSTTGAIVVVLGLLLFGQHVFLASISEVSERAHWNMYAVPLTFAPFFAIGFVVYKLGRSESFAWSMLALSGGAIIAFFSIVADVDLYRSPALYLALTGVVFLTILGAYRTRLPERLTGISGFLGDISYAMYLTHQLPLAAGGFLGTRLGLPIALQIAIVFAASIVLAYLTFRFFEKPARDFLRSRAGPRRDAPAFG